ncbi:MAG: phosphoglycerate dehydrogenase [Nitrospirae bacterium]|nr:phosphoglycerate dehydrogenase [Nitrospirota bacterium]
MIILITTSTFGEFDGVPLKKLKDAGLSVKTNPHGRKLTSDEVAELAKDAVGIIAGTEPLDRGVLEKLPLLKVISRCGTGLDNVDMETAKRLGIKVFNSPDAPTLAVAELTVGLIINLLRKINRMDSDLKAGKWQKKMGNLLKGKNIGIIGFGRIGRKVSELLKPFSVEVAYTDPAVSAKDIKRLSLKDLLVWADIVTIHISQKETILVDKELRLMRKGSWLINISRGGVVDEEALYELLKEGHLAGAALDVFEKEPYDGKLKGLENVILTPHIGSYALEARTRMEKEAVDNLLKGLMG